MVTCVDGVSWLVVLFTSNTRIRLGLMMVSLIINSDMIAGAGTGTDSRRMIGGCIVLVQFGLFPTIKNIHVNKHER